MKKLLTIGLSCAALSVSAGTALAQPTMPMPPMPQMHTMMHDFQNITVVATGTVEYVPDIARMTLGVRAQASNAASAADSINRTAAQVIAALRSAGINERSIKTSGYNLEYREPQPVQPVSPQPVSATTTMPVRSGQYVASEMLQITTPVNLAGRALDAAIGAGANESFGLSYESSKADALYRSALAKAVQSAHDTAAAMAKAAHVTLGAIQSISNSSEPRPMGVGVMQASFARAPVLPGTDAASATVYVVYGIK